MERARKKTVIETNLHCDKCQAIMYMVAIGKNRQDENVYYYKCSKYCKGLVPSLTEYPRLQVIRDNVQ